MNTLKTMTLYACMTALCGVSLSCGGNGGLPEQLPPVDVAVGEVPLTDMQQMTSHSGTIKESKTIPMCFSVAGMLKYNMEILLTKNVQLFS